MQFDTQDQEGVNVSTVVCTRLPIFKFASSRMKLHRLSVSALPGKVKICFLVTFASSGHRTLWRGQRNAREQRVEVCTRWIFVDTYNEDSEFILG